MLNSDGRCFGDKVFIVNNMHAGINSYCCIIISVTSLMHGPCRIECTSGEQRPTRLACLPAPRWGCHQTIRCPASEWPCSSTDVSCTADAHRPSGR